MVRVELFGGCLAGTVTLAIVFSLIPSLAGAQALRFQPQCGFWINAVGGSVKFDGSTGGDTRGDLGGIISFSAPSHFYLSANLGASFA